MTTSQDSASALKSIAARVRALLSKTTENGCSESEALLAAAKARELMDKYQLSMSEAELESEGASQSNTNSETAQQFRIQRDLAMKIARFTDCRCWQGSQSGTVKFFGLQSDSEFAAFLCSSLAGFVQRNAIGYSLEHDGDVASFMLGAVARINERLAELIAARAASRVQAELASHPSGGKSLMLVKNQLVEREFAKLGLNLSRGRASSQGHSNSGSYSAGRAAGDHASFGRPLASHAGGQRLLGRG